MTTYACPLHGEYSDEDFPIQVANCWCPGCSHTKHEGARKAQDDFDRQYRAWHHWKTLSGLPIRGRNRSIDNWKPVGRAQESAGRLVRRYLQDLPERIDAGDGLTLSGPPGTGKTHLACGIVSAAHARGIFARYVVWPDMVDRHKATFRDRHSEDANLLETLRSYRLLVIDEIGVRTGSEFDQSLLFELIDARYRSQRSSIVATNLTPEALDGIGERTADRLREMNATVVIPGQSCRADAALNDALRAAPPALAEPQPPEILVKASINGELLDRPVKISKPEVW